ncbi:MAG: zinc-dependent alcohol dehydrogenase family protein [Acidobacteria bacterium]|nr:zinc-dependent alcohol dehydrogenase family protein [Acidobacteriota bacterium]MBI3421462.1 zinc-dependent alcohol dehydrogenase family protein [Acidobacteriota bacterium]
MKACLLTRNAPIETNPLELTEVPTPVPQPHQILVKVSACGVCRTDLHVIEGELPLQYLPVIPGHQIIGRVAALGAEVTRFQLGVRVGIAWLHETCGQCEYCRAGKENLCEAAIFTGHLVNGGYAEYVVAPAAFVYAIPAVFTDVEAAPLLCAGIIGFRSLRLAGIARPSPGQRLGLYGFGNAAHIAIQIARHWGVDVYAFTRDTRHQSLARQLGAVWAGNSQDQPPHKLDASVIFAPAGELVPPALQALKKGGTLALGGIHMSQIPPLDYQWLYHERVIRSVANNTRQDGADFLRVAAEIPLRPQVELFPLAETNRALNALKHDAIRGAAVIQI